jgi:type I restriction enzyme R subunit
VLPEIEEAFRDAFWGYLLPAKLDFLRLKVGPLLRLAPDVDVSAETFHHKIERLKLAQRTGRDATALVQSIVEDVASLPDFALEDSMLAPLVKTCTPNHLAQAQPAELSRIAAGLAPQMKNRRKVSSFLVLDLPDRIDLSGYILLTQSGEQVYVKEYRLRVEARILALVENHPALQAIGRGEMPDDRLLLDLERTLQAELAGGELELSAQNMRRAYGVQVESFLDFLRLVLEVDAIPGYREVVQHQFQQFIAAHGFNADQIRFMRAVQSVFLQKRRLALPDLYAEPLTNFGADAVDRWFTQQEIQEMVAFTSSLAV